MKLPWKCLSKIITSDKLNIKEESVLIKLLENFMDVRKDFPVPDEDNMKKTYTDNLTVQEKEEREKLRQEETKVKEDEKAAKATEEEAKRNALTTEEAKIDFDMRKEVVALHKKAADNIKVKKLSKKEEKELFLAVRYNFLAHADLLTLSDKDPWKRIAQDYINQGLSYRLNPY